MFDSIFFRKEEKDLVEECDGDRSRPASISIYFPHANKSSVNSPTAADSPAVSTVNSPTSNCSVILNSTEDLLEGEVVEGKNGLQRNAWNSCGTVETHLGAVSQEDLV